LRQNRSEPIPHHPPTSGVIKNHILRADIRVQRMFLMVLQQSAAGSMNKAFGQSCRPGGIQNKKRMIEG